MPISTENDVNKNTFLCESAIFVHVRANDIPLIKERQRRSTSNRTPTRDSWQRPGTFNRSDCITARYKWLCYRNIASKEVFTLNVSPKVCLNFVALLTGGQVAWQVFTPEKLVPVSFHTSMTPWFCASFTWRTTFSSYASCVQHGSCDAIGLVAKAKDALQ